MKENAIPATILEHLEAQVSHLMIAIEHILRENPKGISELALIRQLQASPWELLGPVNFHEPSQLYPVHFLVYHVVYRIRDSLNFIGESLATSSLCLKITTDTVVSGTGVPAKEDELRKYYLDFSHYSLTDSAIESLMSDFWAGNIGQPLDDDALQIAAEELGFESLPGAFDIIKQQFRRMVMEVHPDRGGDTEKVQQLNAAFQTLKNHFRTRT